MFKASVGAVYRRAKVAPNHGGGAVLTAVGASFSTPNITITATTSSTLVAGRFGAAITVNGGAASWYDGAGAASSQSLTLSLTDIGAVAGDRIGIDVGYSLTDPAVTKVYGSESSLYITPSIVTPTISGLSNPPVENETATGVNGTALVRYTNATATTATRSVVWLLDNSTTSDVDNSYTIASGDVGKKLSFRNTTSDGATATSAQTATIISASSPRAFDAESSSASSAAVSSVSWTHIPNNPPTVVYVTVCVLSLPTLQTISSVTYNGVGMSLVTSKNCGAETRRYTAIYELLAPSSGNQAVVVTMSGSCTLLFATAVSATGGDLTTASRANAVATNTSTTPSVAVSSEAVDLVLAAVICDGANSSPIAPGTDVTERWENVESTVSWGGTKTGSATSTTIDCTLTNSNTWGIIAVSSKGK